MTPTFKGKVEYGRLKIDDRDKFFEWVSGLNGKEVEVVVRRPQNRRTRRQNRWYHQVLKLIEQETGQPHDSLHDYFRGEFLQDPTEDAFGYRIRSTTELSTAEMVEYVEQIRRFAAERLDIVIPDPDEVDMPERS